MAENVVPTIDLSAPDVEVAAQMRKACREVGFFVCVGHGISDEQRAALFASSAKFFALPRDEKMAVHTSTNRNNRGWTPMVGVLLCTSPQCMPCLRANVLAQLLRAEKAEMVFLV